MENKQAYFNYEVLEEYIAGIVLTGSELKSIIDNRLSIKESFCVIQDGEIFLRNCHIDKHNVFKFADHEEKRDKKLLLHKKEINKLQKAIKERELYDMKVSMLQRCSKYCQIMQQEPIDENFIEMLTEQIYARIRVINRIQHYIDTEYIR